MFDDPSHYITIFNLAVVVIIGYTVRRNNRTIRFLHDQLGSTHLEARRLREHLVRHYAVLTDEQRRHLHPTGDPSWVHPE